MAEHKNSNLASYVRIEQAAIRSIRLETDLQHKGMADGYVLTSQALAQLARILAGYRDKHPARAWTLTGPYGSGKSYFGLFLMNLLGKNQPDHRAALRALKRADPILAREEVEKRLAGKHGFFPIPITGYRASLQECLWNGLTRATQQLDTENTSDRSAMKAARQPSTSRGFLKLLEQLAQSAADQGYCGTLLIFDELGKPLEYAAAHPEESDIYLLQELAEFANRSGDMPLIFIGIFHQAFERYAVFLDSVTQKEWAKVQGRFEDIPFQEPPTQQLHLLANAIQHVDGTLAKFENLFREQAERAISSGWRPPMMAQDDFAELAVRTYPLHPTTLVALPWVFRRLAQNERSIFAYLASYEPKGFQEFLRHHTAPDFIGLADLFDYISVNYQGRLYTSSRGRVLAETLERLNSTATLSAVQFALLKTIGLLNWLGDMSQIQPTEEALFAAMQATVSDDTAVHKALEDLRKRSIVVYRNFNHTYTIWQGSDVDIEERLQQAHQNLLGQFSPAEMLHRYMPARPLIARRHSYQTGTLRYFDVRYADVHTDLAKIAEVPQDASGLVILCLPLNRTDEQQLGSWAQDAVWRDRAGVVIGIAQPAPRVNELARELLALQWVYEHTPELRDDTVARQEWRTRVATIETLLQRQLDEAFGQRQLSDTKACRWYYCGANVSHAMGRNLTVLLSKVSDKLYHHTPRLWNELLNRRGLTSQAAAARRNLIEAMLTRAQQETLGIQGYPPERSMYESVLNAGGLHRQAEPGIWSFGDPPEEDPLGLLPVWEQIGEFVFSSSLEMRPLEDLYRILLAPPYGLTEGVLPVLLCAFVLAYQGEVTLYREGTLLPEPGIADWEVLLRRPDLFSLAGCRLVGPRRAILERFSASLNVESAVMDVVRELLRRMKTLPEHTWRTHDLPEPALRVRQAVERAQSPELLLFVDLPAAVGLPPFDDQVSDPAHVDHFFDQLNQALEALSQATPRLRASARDELLTAFGYSSGEEGWAQFLVAAQILANYSVNPKLHPLIRRAVDSADPSAAVDSVLAYIASRPVRTWTDVDRDRFRAQLPIYARLLREEQENHDSEELLTPEQRALRKKLVNKLREVLESDYTEDRQVVRAALLQLLREK